MSVIADEAQMLKAQRIQKQLAELFPNPPVPLDHTSDFQLLVAVMLSAQSTDKKVNEITPALFSEAPDAASMARLEVATIATHIKQIGLAPTKSKNLSNMSKLLIERHHGDVPATFEELEALPGVGHKTASVIMSQCHGLDAFPVDTHIHRLAQRWGLTSPSGKVEQTEADLKAVFPDPATWRDLHLQIIMLGRSECPARGHDPAACPLCSWAAVPPFDTIHESPMKAGAASPGKAAAGPKAAKRKARTKGEPSPAKPAQSAKAAKQKSQTEPEGMKPATPNKKPRRNAQLGFDALDDSPGDGGNPFGGFRIARRSPRNAPPPT